MRKPALHHCIGGMVPYASSLLGSCVRTCPACAEVCPTCAGAGLFLPGWVGNPVEVAESIVYLLYRGYALNLCPACGGAVGLVHTAHDSQEES